MVGNRYPKAWLGGVQLNALIKDLQAQNVVLPSGNIDADGTRVLLETSGDFPNVRAIETMLTRVGTTDSLVRLSDLVTVRRGYVSPKVKPIYFNGRSAVVLGIVMQPDQDVTQLGERLRAAARNYEATLPIGYVIDFATYQAGQVRTSVNSALSNVAQTFVVVGALVIVFLGLRACVRRGDDRSIRGDVRSHRHARPRHRDRAGVNCRNYHCARSFGRQRRCHSGRHREPGRQRRAGQ